jgi:hypothetical protein
MTSVLQPQVREFHRRASYSDEAYATCIIPSVNGSPHGVDMTITQARALSVELSRAIYAYDLVEGDSIGPRAPSLFRPVGIAPRR